MSFNSNLYDRGYNEGREAALKGESYINPYPPTNYSQELGDGFYDGYNSVPKSNWFGEFTD